MMVTVAAIQMKSNRPNVNQNRIAMEKKIREASAAGAQIICFPELSYSSYHLTTEQFFAIAEPSNGNFVQWLQALAKELNVVIVGSFPEIKSGNLFISAVVINRSGTVLGLHRKSFLWGKERETFTAGPYMYRVFQTDFCKIGVLICYDIEFAEPARLLALQGVDLILAPSVWSKEAEIRWDVQLPARALDNTCFILGVNTVGEGACGKSKLVHPTGKVLAEASKSNEDILKVPIDISECTKARKQIPYLDDFPKKLTPGGYTEN
ncbi:nitrilase-related carbon-nitrogen hydrolase [Desertibacillus haloalkaliphilus]|uniref:nitrilase-related carbon-nitrogen hydrolase n=1 Tax=Desertibacillus haloalkaliphilus TaxID=1328930 RepID=UPI001C27147C|nr:nitrilase-related carbon-nitrogen hydrolase [Desertibacillus haloalkaliphilus]MBU8906054.1 nitrilase [Desertibacillus haloalkaliphilus]